MPADTAQVQEIDTTTAKVWLDSGDAVMLDVREAPELFEARLDVATHNPMSAFDLESIPASEGKKLVIFCAHGMRSYQVADYLLREGVVTEAYSMSGGMVAWAQAGLPHEKG